MVVKYLVEVDEENDFSIIPDTEIDMLMTTELNFDTEILTEERVRVVRVIIGSASASVTVSLQPGWNLVSFPITPNDSDPDAVFSNHTGRVITGVVWGYRDGSYFAAENIVAATGYWVYNARDGIEHIVVSGFTGDNIGIPDSVQERGFAMVHMSHNSNNRRPRCRFFKVFFSLLKSI